MTTSHLSTEIQPRFWKLFVYSTLPFALAVVVGLWLSARIHGDPEVQAQQQRTEEVIAQDRLLIDALWSAIETIKTRALSLEQVRDAQAHSEARKPTAAPEGSILHWAELEVKDGKLAGVRQSARNPLFQPAAGLDAFESFYLQAALARLNLHELQENGVTVLRIKQDVGRSQEWLSFAFSGAPASDPASVALAATAGTAASAPVVLALVDPAEVFPIFRRWTARSEGGNLRGYLIGSDGFVIAHSQHAYVASDFASTQVFGQGVREMLRGKTRSGAGVFKAIDQSAVTVAYGRPGTLPLAAVVERVNPKVEAQSVLASVWAIVSIPPRDPLLAFACLLAISLVAALGTRRMLRRSVRLAEAFSIASPEQATEEESVDPFEPVDAESPLPVIASAAPFTGSQQVESDLINNLLSQKASEPRARAQRSERVLLAQFETEVQQVQDSASVATRLAQTASKMAQAPALFFSYRESLKACLLQAHSGLPEGTSTEALSFRLGDSMMARIARYQKEGRTASLSDDSSLMLLMSKRLGSSRCEAWPVTGSAGKLLGVLVVLGEGAAQPESEGFGQVMRMSGSLYESFHAR